MNLHKQNFVCWPSVGPQDIKHTYIRKILLLFYRFGNVAQHVFALIDLVVCYGILLV